MSRQSAAPAIPAAPRFAAAWAALVYAACALALGYPALGGRFLLTPVSDQYIGGYAVREFGAHFLRTTGHFPLWNPYIFGGMPYVASMNGDMFYPTFLLRLVLPTDVAMTWSFIIHCFLAGFFTYLFLRAMRFSFPASLAGGLAYMLGGPVAGLVSPGHDGKLYVSALLPLMLYFLVRGIRDGKLWSWGALAITVGLGVLTPHPQLLQYMLLCGGGFALYLAFADSGAGKLPRRVALTRLGYAAGAVALGFLIGAVQYAPVIQYIPWSPRAAGIGGYDRAVSFSMPPEELFDTYLPQFSGILNNYWGRNGFHLHSEYLGAVVLLLAGLGIGCVSRGEKRRGLTWFWIGTLIISTLWALGGFTPFYQLIYALVPGTKYFRAPSAMMMVMALSVAVLAAIGTERLMAGRVTIRYAAAWLVAAAIIALLGVTGALTNMAGALAVPGRSGFAVDNGPQIAFGAVRSFVCILLAAGVVFAVAQRRIAANVAAYVLIALVAADLWSVEQLYWNFSAPASALFANDAITDFLNKDDQPSRVFAYPIAQEQVFHDQYLKGDGLMPHRIRSVLGYHGNELGRYDNLFGENDQQLGNPQIWRLTNMKYFLTNSPQSPFAGTKLVLGPVTDPSGSTLYLFEMPGSYPFAWVAPVIVKGPDDAVLTTVRDPRFDISRAALFDTAAPVHAQQISKLPDTLGIVARATHYEPGHITVDLDKPAPAGAALVVTENYYPGWSATVDGKPAAIGRADYVLIGVELPAGAKTIQLDFTSPAFEKGKAITLAVLAFCLLLLAGGVVAERRKAHG